MKWPQLRRADWLLVGLLLPLALLAALLGQLTADDADEPTGPVPTASSFHNDAPGTRAVYLVWGRLGYDVDRLRRPIARPRLAEADALVVLSPWQPMLPEEQRELLQWVRDGGRLLIVPGAMMELDWLNIARQAPPVQRPAWRDRDDEEDEAQRVEGDKALTFASPLLDGVNELSTRPMTRLHAEQPLRGDLAGHDYAVFWRDELGIAGLEVAVGEGRIWVLGDTHPLTNRGVSEADNAVFAANLAAVLTDEVGGGRIRFDEFHHGFLERDASGVAMVRLILDEGRIWAAMQGLLVLALTLTVAMVRFGRPRDEDVAVRRTQREFIEAAARLLDESGGEQRVGQILYHHYHRRLCRRVHLAEHAEDAALAQAVADRGGGDIADALRTLSVAAVHHRLGEAPLLRSARTLHQALETLTHGTR